MIVIVGLCLGPPNTILPAYIIDCFRDNGASVIGKVNEYNKILNTDIVVVIPFIACNNFVRYILAGIGTLVSSDMAYSMGSGPLYTFCGALLFVSSLLFIIVKLRGNIWRQKHNQQQALKKQQQEIS